MAASFCRSDSDRNTLRRAFLRATDAGFGVGSGADDVGVGSSVSVGEPFAVFAVTAERYMYYIH